MAIDSLFFLDDDVVKEAHLPYVYFTMSQTTTQPNVIVLTGASGYLGQHVLHSMMTAFSTTPPLASDEGAQQVYEIHALYHTAKNFESRVLQAVSSAAGAASRVTVHVTSLDLTQKTQIQEWKENHQLGSSSGKKIVVCIHTAAMSSPRACEDYPERAMELNVPKAFFRALQGVPIIALSTDQVYDGSISIDDAEQGVHGYYLEDDVVDAQHHPPKNVYGKSKLKMEQYLQEHHAGPYVALRSSIILGPKAPIDPDGAHDTFLHFVQSRSNQETTYFDNEYRTVVSVQLVVATIHWLIRHYCNTNNIGSNPNTIGSSGSSSSSSNSYKTKVQGVYNMGGPHRVNRHDMARAVFDHFGYDPKYVVAAQQTSPISPLDISMDSRKLQQLTELEPFPVTFQELVQFTFA
jgi:dTDP-4-dehydrorhamnose reductase